MQTEEQHVDGNAVRRQPVEDHPVAQCQHLESIVRSAQASFNSALGGIVDAQSTVIKDVHRLKYQFENSGQHESAMASRLDKLEARQCELDSNFKRELQDLASQQSIDIGRLSSGLKTQNDELRLFCKDLVAKSMVDSQERSRVFTKSGQDSLSQRLQSLEFSMQETMKARDEAIEARLLKIQDAISLQLATITNTVNSDESLMERMMARASDVDERFAEYTGELKKVWDQFNETATIHRVAHTEMNILSLERTTNSLERKLEETSGRLAETSSSIRQDLEKEVERTDGLTKVFDDSGRRFDQFHDRVGKRFGETQEDISAMRRWTQKKLDSHAESLRKICTCLNQNGGRRNSLQSQADRVETLYQLPKPAHLEDSNGDTCTPNDEGCEKSSDVTTESPQADDDEDATKEHTSFVQTAVEAEVDDMLVKIEEAETVDLAPHILERLDKFETWQDGVDKCFDKFSDEVYTVHHLAKVVEARSDKIVSMETHLEDLASEAKRMLELQMCAKTKCLSCGQGSSTGYAGRPSREPSPPPDEAEANDTVACPHSRNERSISVTDINQLIVAPPQYMPARSPGQRPGSASRVRKKESDFSVEKYEATVGAVVGRQTPAGNALSACRIQTVSKPKSRRPASARARIGDSTRR